MNLERTDCRASENPEYLTISVVTLSKATKKMSNDENDCGFRPRSINFNQQEVCLLLDLIEELKVAILNRSTTAAANKKKHKAWMQIAKVFKEKGIGPERTEECLRNKWENLKRESSKQAKNEMEMACSEKKSTLNRVLALSGETEKSPAEPTQDEFDDYDEDSKDVDKKGNVFWDDCQGGNEDKQSGESMDEDADDGADSGKMVKNRSINFSPLESRLLLQCIRPEKKYILSTEITSKANLMKSKAWERVTEEFNKRNPVKRSHLTLRTKLENMKKIAKRSSFKDYMKDFGKEHQKLVNENTLPHKIKAEPISKDRDSTENTNDGYTVQTVVEVEPIEPLSQLPVNHHPVNSAPGNEVFMDPLSTVLNRNVGNSWSQPENKEVVRLQMELLNFQMETAKLERERVMSKIQSDATERQARALETSLRLRAARLEAAAAEMKLPTGHPATLYAPAEQRAQHYANGGDCV